MQGSHHLPEDRTTLVPNQPEISDPTTMRVEAYLDHLFAPLASQTTEEQRHEMRAEAREHLLARIAAYEELGSTPEEAVTQTLQQFGKANQVARKWSYNLNAEGTPSWECSRTLAARYFIGSTVLLTAILFGTGSLLNYDGSLFHSFYLLLPCATGLGVGLLAPSQPVRATLAALLKLSAPTTLIYLLWTFTQHFQPWHAVPLFCSIHAISWTLIGSAAAGVGGLLKRAGRKLRTARFASR